MERSYLQEKIELPFYQRDTSTVARELLGCYLVHDVSGVGRVGKIVETEAYLGPSDLAAHSARGRTSRTEVLFGPPGRAYVYLVYGIYYCLNVVTEREGNGCAVLIRALEPVENVLDATRGPGLLCRALEIDRRLNGHDLQSDDFFLCTGESTADATIAVRPRIGVDYAGEWADRPLRFYLEGSRYISRK